MNENQFRNVVKKIFIIFFISIVPLAFSVGCGENQGLFGEGCKLDLYKAIQCSNEEDLKELNIDTGDTTYDALLIKGCHSCFGADVCSGCLWTDYHACYNLKYEENPSFNSAGCITTYPVCNNCGGYDEYHDAFLYYCDADENTTSPKDMTGFIGCESTCLNCSAGVGIIDGCACAYANSNEEDNTIGAIVAIVLKVLGIE